ncbi:Alpha-galactosidase [Melia azedarach]|uniref:Alpha-galactosidase n=1 Tax=Melia azedarach TaxID=155640 RepID=A0ACC1XHK3_MELAZ|nr:Alpha-galactosidase [Melia azedarach]
MKTIVLSTLFLYLGLSLCRVSSETMPDRELDHASLPPRGWNSYDSFCWTISEEEFLQSAEIVSQHLCPHGYKYAVVDYLWYRRKVEGAYVDSLGFDVIDEWGRMMPDPDRWPSSRGGKWFTEVAKKVHAMGLKFGIHIMRGISTQAVNANTPILDILKGGAYEESGRQWRAKDIGLKERACAWMQHGFMSVNTKLEAGRAFLRSLYKQYAEWGVDLVKHDCVFGDDLDIDEISFVSDVLKELDHPILYSVSPGTSVTPAMAKDVSGLVNMYRITGDDWDTWGDVAAHFNVTRDFSTANMIGAKGMLGKSWPDLDMPPLGWLTDPGSNEGPHRACNLNLAEQRTQMTLWAMARSPLMFGGDVRKLDETTYSLITNPTVLEINTFSSNNREFPYITGTKGKQGYQIHEFWVLPAVRILEQMEEGDLLLSIERFYWLIIDLRDEETIYQQQCQRKLHLQATEGMEVCLDVSPKRKLTSKEFKRGSFSKCKRDANQMWELNPSGALINSYSGLCATINSVKASVDSGGIRAWIATGRRGEIYVAFFNLNNEKTVISAKLSDLGKALPSKNINGYPCKGREVWSGEDYGVLENSISAAIEMHGCA